MNEKRQAQKHCNVNFREIESYKKVFLQKNVNFCSRALVAISAAAVFQVQQFDIRLLLKNVDLKNRKKIYLKKYE